MNSRMFKRALTRTLPIMAGYLVLGFGFGVLLASKGYGVFYAFLMCIVIYGGSMQYIGAGLLASGAGVVTTALITLMVHARHIFYALSMIDKFKPVKKFKFYLAFALTDETYSLLVQEKGLGEQDRMAYYLWVSLLDHLYWIAGSVLGAAAGNLLQFNTAGIEFAMTALFVSIFTGQWLEQKNHSYALLGLGFSALALWVFGPERFLIPAMVLITIALLLLKKREEGKDA